MWAFVEVSLAWAFAEVLLVWAVVLVFLFVFMFVLCEVDSLASPRRRLAWSSEVAMGAHQKNN